jgi:hypothetical protein
MLGQGVFCGLCFDDDHRQNTTPTTTVTRVFENTWEEKRKRDI